MRNAVDMKGQTLYVHTYLTDLGETFTETGNEVGFARNFKAGFGLQRHRDPLRAEFWAWVV